MRWTTCVPARRRWPRLAWACIAGVDHVGIGADFFAQGAEHLPIGLEDVSRYPYLLAELCRRG